MRRWRRSRADHGASATADSRANRRARGAADRNGHQAADEGARARAGHATPHGVPAGVGLVDGDETTRVVAISIGVSESRAGHQSERSNTRQYLADHASSPFSYAEGA